MRPDSERVELIGYWLARALKKCPGIRLHSVSVPSNHGHLEVTDEHSEMSKFMACFLGPLAKDINYLDGVRGQFLERRFNATEIVDDDALIDRIAYTVTNPKNRCHVSMQLKLQKPLWRDLGPMRMYETSENRTSSDFVRKPDGDRLDTKAEMSGTDAACHPTMRPPRRWRPGARWSIVFRCARTEYRMRPDSERVELIGYWLARALKKCPGIRLHSVSVPSNHGHLEVTDEHSEMSKFMACFLGPLAKDINYLDGVRGQFLERRFNATEIVDDDALIDRIAYTVTNPVDAGLVKRHQDWPGLSCWFGSSTEPRTFGRFRRRAWDWACHIRGEVLPTDDFYAFETLELHAPDGIDEEATRQAIDRREAEVCKAQVLGADAATRTDPRARPDRSKRGTRPVCHASSPEMWTAFLHGWKKFVKAYREASRAFREGAFGVVFPAHCYRPWVPLLE